MNKVTEVTLSYKSKIKPSEREQIKQSSDAEKIFRSIEHYNNNIELFECFYAMYMNKQNKVLSVMLISEGGTSGTIVDIKKIIAPAILQNASAVIVSHNHPSGNTTPSENDKQITTKIKNALKLLDVNLLDHLIITPESYLSFSDINLI